MSEFNSVPAGTNLTAAQFDRVCTMLRAACGIALKPGKEALVKSRLHKRMRALTLSCFDEYLDRVEAGPEEGELARFVDELTTNKTSFFREHAHFDCLRAELAQMPLQQTGQLRLWSAGCSSGEEPYTLGMVLREAIAPIDELDVRILATDISAEVLQTARHGLYPEAALKDVPADLRRRYLSAHDGVSAISDDVRKMVTFVYLNLMGPWPMAGPFDAIFCRNVMIYFNRQTRIRLVARFRQLLRPGGLLFIGHSESLTGMSDGYQYVQPAAYRRAA